MAIVQLTGDIHSIVKLWTGEELVFRPDGNALKVMPPFSNGEKYVAVQSDWFQEFITELFRAVKGLYMKRVQFEGGIVLLRDSTMPLQRGDVKEYKCLFVQVQPTGV